MDITDQHNGVIINGSGRGHLSCSIAHCGIDHLVITVNRIRLPISIACLLIDRTNCLDVVSSAHILVIHYVGIRIGHIYALGPIGLYGDGRHAFGNVKVCTLAEYTFIGFAVNILGGAVAVSKVVRSCKRNISIFINSCSCVRARSNTASRFTHTNNLPACYHAAYSTTIFPVVVRSNLVVIRQLYLVVVEVEMFGVFVGDVARDRRRSD